MHRRGRQPAPMGQLGGYLPDTSMQSACHLGVKLLLPFKKGTGLSLVKDLIHVVICGFMLLQLGCRLLLEMLLMQPGRCF